MSEESTPQWIRRVYYLYLVGLCLLTASAILYIILIVATVAIGAIDVVVWVVADGMMILAVALLLLWGIIDGLVLLKGGYQRIAAHSFAYATALGLGITANLYPGDGGTTLAGLAMIGIVAFVSQSSESWESPNIPLIIHWCGAVTAFTSAILSGRIMFQVWAVGSFLWGGGLLWIGYTRMTN